MYRILHKPSGKWVSSGGSHITLTDMETKSKIFPSKGILRAHITKALKSFQYYGVYYKNVDEWEFQEIEYSIKKSSSLMEVIEPNKILGMLKGK